MSTSPATSHAANLDHIAAPLRPLAVAVADLAENPHNARTHPERNLEILAGSLKQFRQVKPIVLAADGRTVIAGNGTVQAAKKLGWTHLAAVKSGLDGAAAKAYGIADNRATDLSEFNVGNLSHLLGSLDDELLGATGFTAEEAEFLADLAQVDVTGVGNGLEDPRKVIKRNVTVRLLITSRTVSVIERAIKKTGMVNRAGALAAICEAYLGDEKIQFNTGKEDCPPPGGNGNRGIQPIDL